MATWRFIKWAWFAIFAVGLVIFLAFSQRLAAEVIGASAVLVGLCLALDLGGSATAAVHELRTRHAGAWPRALVNVTFFRCFGAAFGLIGAVFLAIAWTGSGPFAPTAA